MKLILLVVVGVFVVLCNGSRFAGVYQKNHLDSYESAAAGIEVDTSFKDLEPSYNKFDWSSFDATIRKGIKNDKAMSVGLYTGKAVPSWIYDHGVPKVHVKNDPQSPTWPYYLSKQYTDLFRNVHAEVKKHFDTAYTAEEQKYIVGLEMVFGSTGDVTPWHGTPTEEKYKIPMPVWYEYWGNESCYVASLYKDWASDPKHEFYLINRDLEKFEYKMSKVIPNYAFANQDHEVCKQYQETGEKTSLTSKNLEYNISHVRKGVNQTYILSDCQEDSANQEGKKTDRVVSHWATMTYELTWGQDKVTIVHQWGDKRLDQIALFFNKYAGMRKDEGKKSMGAWASLRDGLDSADKHRFSEAKYGAAKQSSKERMLKIVAAFAKYGAKQDDPEHAVLNTQAGRGRNGMNACGWDISPDNYHQFLVQLDADKTSIGRWRVGPFNDGGAGQFMGRFARSFDHANGKDEMFFQIQGGVFTGFNGDVLSRVVYYDDGVGSWSLNYGLNCSQSVKVTKKNTKKLVEFTTTLKGSNPFSRGCKNGADLTLKNEDKEDDSFSFLEFSKTALTDLFVTP